MVKSACGTIRNDKDGALFSEQLTRELHALQGLFRSVQAHLASLGAQAAKRVAALEAEVRVRETEHAHNIREAEDLMEGLVERFALMDERVSSIGQTAARIGDRLKAANHERTRVVETITKMEHLMAFRAAKGDLSQLPEVFLDDERLAEAATIAQQLRAFAQDVVAASAVAPAGKGAPAPYANDSGTWSSMGESSASPFDVNGNLYLGNGMEATGGNDRRGSGGLEEGRVEGSGKGGVGGDKATVDAGDMQRALTDIQSYCEKLETRILRQFDAAELRGDLAGMQDCALTLVNFNGGASVMQRYVASRPMFMDASIVLADATGATALGDGSAPGTPVAGAPRVSMFANTKKQAATTSTGPGGQKSFLWNLFEGIRASVAEEAQRIAQIFPAPATVMSMLVQRVMEQRVQAALDTHLPDPANLGLSSEGSTGFGRMLLTYLRHLSTAFVETQALAASLREIGCGDLDVEGLAESLFSAHREAYLTNEVRCLNALMEGRVEAAGIRDADNHAHEADAGGGSSRGRSGSKLGPTTPPPPAAPVSAFSRPPVGLMELTMEFLQWNREALSRCHLLSSQRVVRAANVRRVFHCLLAMMEELVAHGRVDRCLGALISSQITLRQCVLSGTFVTSASTGRKGVAAQATVRQATIAAEAAVEKFFDYLSEATSALPLVQEYMEHSISAATEAAPSAQVACRQELAGLVRTAEQKIVHCLQATLEVTLARVEGVLLAEQHAVDFLPPEAKGSAAATPRNKGGMSPMLSRGASFGAGSFGADDSSTKPTAACTHAVAILRQLRSSAEKVLDNNTVQAFLAELGGRLHDALLAHIKRFMFSPAGGVVLKRDVAEYLAVLDDVQAPTARDRFESLKALLNVLVVAPRSLKLLMNGALGVSNDVVMGYVALRSDCKSAKLLTTLLEDDDMPRGK
eukprot:jgi/Mesvir1/16638/Mv10171-RA.1